MAIKNELSAGGIVFRKTSRGPEILLIRDHQGKWTFPKGHVEDGEAATAAAVRETREETGLPELTARDEVGKIDYWFKDKWSGTNDLIHKTVRYYLLEAPADAEPKPPQDWSQGTEPITDAKWFTFKEAIDNSGYKDNTKLLKKAMLVLQSARQESLL